MHFHVLLDFDSVTAWSVPSRSNDLLESLVDLTPVVDSVEAALLKETELREKRIDWEDLERTYGYLGVTTTSFIQQFDKMRAALIKVDRGTSLDIVQQLVHFLTADASPGPKGSRQRKVSHLLSRLQADFDLGAFTRDDLKGTVRQ